MDLNSILEFLEHKKIKINSEDWNKAYSDLVELLYAVGNLTEKTKEINTIIDKLDKIDSSKGDC